MKKVVLRAPTLTQSGYGQHARSFARWLLKKPEIELTFQLLQWGNTPWFVDKNALDGLVGKIVDRCRPAEKPDVAIQLQLPNEFDTKLGACNVGITALVETDKCNPEWVTACNAMDAIVVPSSHAKTTLLRSGTVTPPVHVIPEPFTDACVQPLETLPTLPDFSTDFNFLVFGQLTGNTQHNDRKNTYNTLKWMFEQFAGDEKVGIVLKTNAGRNTLIDRDNVRAMVQQAINDGRKGPYPRLHLLHGDMSDAEVAALYNHKQIKALVSLTRGEGYGLPILEAAACGLPIMATGWSGHTDFLKHGKYINVFYNLTDVHPSRIDGKIFVQGARWAEPSEQDFKKKIAKFYSSSAIPREWAKELQQKIVTEYSQSRIEAIYDDVLGRLL